MKEQNSPIHRNHRKEVQFSDEEWKSIVSKSSAATLQPAVYIREAALHHQLQAAMTDSEREQYKRSTAMSSRYLNNLNQLARVMNTYEVSPQTKKTFMEFIKRADRYLQTGDYKPLDLAALEKELKSAERSLPAQSTKPIPMPVAQQNNDEIIRLKARINELEFKLEVAEREKEDAVKERDEGKKLYDSLFETSRLITADSEHWKAEARKYYYLTTQGMESFMAQKKFKIYPNNRGDQWFIKTGEELAKELPKELWLPWRKGEITIVDVYQRWCEEHGR